MHSPSETLKALYHVRETQLKQKLGSYDKEHFRTMEIHGFSEALWKRYRLPEIHQVGEVELSTKVTRGFDERGRVSLDLHHVAITLKIHVVHDELIPQLLELTRRRIFTPASGAKYLHGIVTLEAVVAENQLEINVEHLKSDLEKRNRIIRTENEAFHRTVTGLIIAARNHYWAPGRA